MTTDERTPGAEAPSEQSGAEAPAEQSGAEAPAEQSGAEAPDEDDISKNLLMQVGIVGGIVLLVLLAVFFGVI